MTKIINITSKLVVVMFTLTAILGCPDESAVCDLDCKEVEILTDDCECECKYEIVDGICEPPVEDLCITQPPNCESYQECEYGICVCNVLSKDYLLGDWNDGYNWTFTTTEVIEDGVFTQNYTLYGDSIYRHLGQDYWVVNRDSIFNCDRFSFEAYYNGVSDGTFTMIRQ